MNTYVSSVVAAERHQGYLAQADAHRRSNRSVRRHSGRRNRLGAFVGRVTDRGVA